MSRGYMSQGVYVLGGKCPGGKCPGGKCPGVYVLGVSVRGVHVRGGYVLEPCNGHQGRCLSCNCPRVLTLQRCHSISDEEMIRSVIRFIRLIIFFYNFRRGSVVMIFDVAFFSPSPQISPNAVNNVIMTVVSGIVRDADGNFLQSKCYCITNIPHW